MGLRRVPARHDGVASDPELLGTIRREIREHGPITFARFMAIALYDPERGYYRGSVARPGRAGDFLTAPEAHPLFGRTIARFALAVHAALGAPDDLTIREHGAGTGALAGPLVAAVALAERRPPRLRYLGAVVEPARVGAVRDAVATAVLDAAGSATDPMSVTVEADDGRPIDGLVVANEVLDALATHRVVQRGERLREILVGLDPDGDLADVEADPTTDELPARLRAERIRLADGQRAEICLALERWIAHAAVGLGRGVLLLIDYGHHARDLYDPARRAGGTLATYLGHQVAVEPYRAIGRQDITAHVDVTAVDRAARAAGLARLGETSQAGFLNDLGAGDLLVEEQHRPGATIQSYLEARAALVRMIDPAAMGGFRVLAYGGGLPSEPALPGFTGRDPIARRRRTIAP